MNFHCVIEKYEKCVACRYTSKKYPSRGMFYGDVTEHHPKELPNIKIPRTNNVNYPYLPDCKISIKKSLQTR